MISRFIMGSSSKLSILLADEDALRRDGLSAVLSGTSGFEVVSGVADGEQALASIRERRPDVAVIDLNLPKIHGIELIRRIRAESLPTKIVIMASTDDAEIVREAVRAGVDGYLLKNSPARHLVDAILYVRDGGQYFSPQLGRDGRDRQFLEEPARTPAQPPPAERYAGDDADDEGLKQRPRSARRPEPQSLKQRLREETTANLNDRDFEIMSMMADGIRPILDRLDEIDSRVSMMETGDVEIPGDPRTWLTTQLTQSVGGRGGRDMGIGRNVDDFETRLPQLIEEAVTKRFSQMAGKLQQEIEDTHVRTMESFVKNIQVKLMQRVTALEQDMSRHSDAMKQLREYSQRTEENLGRLISGVDRLAQDLPRRLAAVKPQAEEAPDEILQPAPRRVRRPGSGGGRVTRMAIAGVFGVVVLGLLGWGLVATIVESPDPPLTNTTAASAPANGKEDAAKAVAKSGTADSRTKFQAAQEAMDRKDYAVAEDVYRSVLKTEPNNTEAIKGLASLLFREDKTDEAAAVLDKLPKD